MAPQEPSKDYRREFSMTIMLLSLLLIGVLFAKVITVNIENNTHIDYINLFNSPNRIVKMLIWNTGWLSHVDGLKCAKLFPNLDIFITTDRKLLKDCNYVVVHNNEYGGDIPFRPDGQQWVWFNMESPAHCRKYQPAKSLYNLTATYRYDSDIPAPYGFFRRKDQKSVFDPYYTHRSTDDGPIYYNITKTKLVSWFVSNWNPQFARVKYYNKLQKYIPIDVYGGRFIHFPKSKNQCNAISNYKFYLSFENSQYKDYITEKTWRNGFRCGAVPIVLGPSRQVYEKLLPPNSFIHVDDFSSPKDLAQYLLELDKDNDKYMKYHQWREKYVVFDAGFYDYNYCVMAHDLATRKANEHYIPDIYEWFKNS